MKKMKKMEVEIWRIGRWRRASVVGERLSSGYLFTNEGKLYHNCHWREIGTRPYAGCVVSGIPVSKKSNGVGKVEAKKAKTIAGPFKKSDLWMAEKMIEKNQGWKLEKRGSAWWVV
jgi:hypothetical protein